MLNTKEPSISLELYNSYMKQTPTIAQVLHLAADKYLYNGECNSYEHVSGSFYSCCAIARALAKYHSDGDLTEKEYQKLDRIIFKGLKNMGLVPSSTSQFKEFECSWAASQGARYAWLKFAAMIAEEQGV